MNIAIFGLSVSSTWGNGHAALWRGLIAGAGGAGPRGDFLRARRALLRGEPRPARAARAVRLVLYSDWAEVRPDAPARWRRPMPRIVTSYCPDAIAGGGAAARQPRRGALLLRPRHAGDAGPAATRRARGLSAPSGLARVRSRAELHRRAGAGCLAHAAGRAPRRAALRLGRSGAASAGHAHPHYRAALSYLGTYAADRQAALERLFVEPARRGRGAFRDRRRAISAGFSLDGEHLVRPPLPPAEHRRSIRPRA